MQLEGKKHWNSIYSDNHAIVLEVCYRILGNLHEAEDCCHEIFNKLFENFQKHKVHDYSRWLRRVAQYHCYHHLRKKKSKCLKDYQQENAQQIVEEPPLEYDHENQLKKQINQAIQKLKPEQRECIELFYFERLSYKEIALKKQIMEKRVKSHLQCAKRNLRLQLGDWQQFAAR